MKRMEKATSVEKRTKGTQLAGDKAMEETCSWQQTESLQVDDDECDEAPR